MHNKIESVRANPGSDSGLFSAAAFRAVDAGIDPVVLAQLDAKLFESLRRIGHSRERICSALCLSYAEYDTVLKFMEGP